MNDNIKEKIRQALYSSTNLKVTNDEGTTEYVTKDNSLAKKICRIEKTIREVIDSRATLFTESTDKRTQKKFVQSTRLGASFLACFRSDLSEIKEHYPIHRFNPFADLMMLHWERGKYSVLRLKERFISSDEVSKWVGIANRLVKLIRRQARTSAFKKIKSDHMRSANKNYQGLRNYIHALFERHSRLVVIRIDLGYLSGYGWPNGVTEPVTPIQFRTHKEQLIKGLDKLLPEALIGSACKLEYGLDKSFHIHLLVFLDGSKVREDVTLGKIIGDYWDNTVTAGKGMHFNCNAVKAKYGAKCAVGMIESSNEVALEILKTDIALYLTKTDYYIKLVLGDGGRTFFKGNMPKPRTSNRGRPRTLKIAQLTQELGTAAS